MRAREGQITAQPPLDAQALPDQRVELSAQARLTLAFPGGASAELRGPGRALLAPKGQEALLMRAGSVTVDLPPSALTPDSGLWIALPNVQLRVVQGARFALRAFDDGSAALAVASGTVSLEPRGAGEDQGPLTVLPSQVVRISPAGAAQRSDRPLPTLELARAWVEGQTQATPGSLDAQATLAPRFEAALRMVELGEARERELSAAHTDLVAKRDPGAFQAQRALAEHAAAMFRDRRRLAALLAQYEAATLGDEPGGPGPLATRAHALLGP